MAATPSMECSFWFHNTSKKYNTIQHSLRGRNKYHCSVCICSPAHSRLATRCCGSHVRNCLSTSIPVYFDARHVGLFTFQTSCPQPHSFISVPFLSEITGVTTKYLHVNGRKSICRCDLLLLVLFFFPAISIYCLKCTYICTQDTDQRVIWV